MQRIRLVSGSGQVHRIRQSKECQLLPFESRGLFTRDQVSLMMRKSMNCRVELLQEDFGQTEEKYHTGKLRWWRLF